jgi:hypothetical protein
VSGLVLVTGASGAGRVRRAAGWPGCCLIEASRCMPSYRRETTVLSIFGSPVPRWPPGSCDVLVHLAWAPSGTLPLHELTASMVVADALSRSGITHLLNRMERDGLITRTVSTTDRRRFDVSLTPSGQQRFEQAWRAHVEGIGRYFVQPLAPRDISELARIPDSLVQANENHNRPG